MHQGWRIDVQGIVQGVGFRPFIYRLAKRFDLSGSVSNTAAGVSIEIIASKIQAYRFIRALKREAPPLAQIVHIELIPTQLSFTTDFSIDTSRSSDPITTMISPDIATCEDCTRELLDPGDRRYLYPFINCTNCGPRYTIIVKMPYDRPNTSMTPFSMCPQCLSEYENPQDRRFHAQPNACPVCGPHVYVIDDAGNAGGEDSIEICVQALRDGKIAGIKSLGGFHLAVDAYNDEAVSRLRRRKHRFEKPLAVMAGDIAHVRRIVTLSSLEENILQNAIKPIVLCRKRENSALAASLSLDNNDLGIMLPYTPLHKVLFKKGHFCALVMTSANISEEPICFKNEEARQRLKNIADIFLMHNRDIYTRCDDSVIRIFKNELFFIRRSRGFAPRPLIVTGKGPHLLAVGGQVKNTIALCRENRIFLSQHIGDLENLETLLFFEHTINHMKKLFEIDPAFIIHDKHPQYLATRWCAEKADVPTAGIQHHYAHILSVMAENNLTDAIIGIAFDGTGYGDDGTIWGGEILICDSHSYRRFAHLDPVHMPGGEQAIKEPWRMAVAGLKKVFSDWQPVVSDFFPSQQHKIALIEHQIDKEINSPLTSSCGRLFDIVAALLGLREQINYEGQAAIILESLANRAGKKPKIDIGSFSFHTINGRIVISYNEIIRQIITLRAGKIRPELISAAFHNALADMVIRITGMASKETGIKLVALSGGCFQNMYLLSAVTKRLTRLGYRVLYNRLVPVNDGGIALGQAYWGIYNYKKFI